ncbi:hypothetical protein AB0J80_21630 [Actinoplanes sp. NPDC049548]|uniref:hypothetical protein n=1 Tax=Actinoplanes sp. NPDC049548 TaxID=3155152 RepID=UPI003426380C
MSKVGRRVPGVIALVTMSGLLLVAPARAAPVAVARYDAPIGRTQVMIRALDWLRRDIPYSQDNRRARWDIGRGRRYRPDCSGFVAMAWALDPRRAGLGRAPVTWELPRYATRVSYARLRRGDILLHLEPANRAAEHVQLFAGWVGASRSRAWVIEESGRLHGMRRRTVAVARARTLYSPYRYRLIS